MSGAGACHEACQMRVAEYKQLAQDAIAMTLAQGAQAAAVVLQNVQQTEIDCCEGRVEKLQEAVEQSLALDIYVDSRFSQHSTCNLQPAAVRRFIQDAVAMTRFLMPDPFRTLPDPALCHYNRQQLMQNNDADFDTLDAPQKIALAAASEKAARMAHEAVVSATTSAELSRRIFVKMTSNGFYGESTETFFGLSAEVTVRDARGGLPEDWAFALSHYCADLPDAATIGIEAARRAVAKIGQKKLACGRYAVIVENRAASQLLGMLIAPLKGRALQQKNSCLDGKIGSQIGSPALTMVDDPFLPKGMRSRLFDQDGIATSRRVVFDQGVLRSYYIDHYYGQKMNLAPTNDGPANIILEGGTRSAATMTRELQSGLFITGLLGGNFNATSGDFSFGVMGLVIHDGQVRSAFNEMNLSGNLLSFWQGLAEVGDDSFPYSAMRAPALHFPDIELSGL